MPKVMDGNYFGTSFSGIQIDEETMNFLKDAFLKFLPENAPPEK